MQLIFKLISLMYLKFKSCNPILKNITKRGSQYVLTLIFMTQKNQQLIQSLEKFLKTTCKINKLLEKEICIFLYWFIGFYF